MPMAYEEAARILDPDTTREVLNQYADSSVERMRLPDEACRDGGECVKCWIEWLRKPAEED